MPIETLVTSQKFLNQFNNGVDFSESTGDFTQNSVGSAIDLLNVETEIKVSWLAEASQSNRFTFIRNTDTDWTIERPSGSFADDGFWVGARVQLARNNGLGTINTSFPLATIDEISSDGSTIQLTGDALPNLNSGDYSDINLFPVIDSSNELTSLILGFGIIGENEQYNIRSKVSNNPQQYYFSGIDATGVNGIAKGTFNDFVTGSTFCQTIATTEDYTQAFRITHIFRIVPYYLDGELSNLKDNNPPDLFTQSSLKYAFDVEFRQVLSNPNRAIKATFDSEKGSIGWFNQNFNGFDNNYAIDSIVYEDVATTNETEGLQLSGRTKATITVSKVGGLLSAGQRAGVFVSYLPNQSEYQNTVTNLDENYLLDSIYHNEGDSAGVGTGIIKSVDSSIVSDKVVLEVEFEYTTAQQLRLTTESNYLIAVQIADASIPSGNSDRVSLIADVNTYKKGAFIEGLFNITSFGYLVNGNKIDDAGETEIAEIWNEDSIAIKGSFDLDLSKEAFLERLEFALVAFNTVTNSYFLLDSRFLNMAGSTVSLGSQQITINESRGYEQVFESELFNNITITTGAKVGDLQSYNFNFAQKIKWQDWIFNPNANTVFYDNTKPNDNLNFKSSNYSGLQDYEIKMLVIANTTGIDDLGRDGIGRDIYEGGNITVKDYGVSDTSYAVAQVRTLDPDTLADLGGAVLSDRPTLVESRFTGTGISNTLILHRYERTNQLGDVLPEIVAELSIDGTEIVGRTLLSNNLFDGSSAYNFTARIFRPFLQFQFTTTHNTATDGNFQIQLLGGTKTWIFGSDTVTGDNPNYSGSYLDGTPKVVKVVSDDFSSVTSFQKVAINPVIVGKLDLSILEGLSNVTFLTGDFQLDEFIGPKSNLSTFQVLSSNFTGNIDFFRDGTEHSGSLRIGRVTGNLKTGTGFLNDFNVPLRNDDRILDVSETQITGNFTSINCGEITFGDNGNSLSVINLDGYRGDGLDLTFAPAQNVIASNASYTTIQYSPTVINLTSTTIRDSPNVTIVDFGGARIHSGSTSYLFVNLDSFTTANTDQLYIDLYNGWVANGSPAISLTIDSRLTAPPSATSSFERGELSSAGANIVF